jgi:hypothetical protein
MHASRQWASRPSDERFTSLPAMHAMMEDVRERSIAKVIPNRQFRFEPDASDGDKGLVVTGPNGGAVVPTNWAFGQLAGLAKAPAGYLRSLHPALAADCINYGLHVTREVEEVGILLTAQDGRKELRAATGPDYGRIWNKDVVGALMQRFGDGVTGDWKIPGEFGQAVEVSKANTTLFASDRDMFVFLADETNRIEIPNRRDGKNGSLARGFFVGNSEVGAGTLFVAMFLFDYACCNRIVWGAQQFVETRIRHTSGAPTRWIEEARPMIYALQHASAAPIEAKLRAAQAQKVDNLDAFLAKRNFTKSQASGMKAIHELEEGRPIESLWDVATAATAYARGIDYQDTRIDLERAAGKVLDLVAA